MPNPHPGPRIGRFEVGAVFAITDMSRKPDGGICMMWAALRESDTDLFMRAPIEEVRQNMAGTGYPPDLTHLVRGPVEQTLPERAPERIAVLRLDTDWYDSTRHELLHLYPRLAAGGILVARFSE